MAERIQNFDIQIIIFLNFSSEIIMINLIWNRCIQKVKTSFARLSTFSIFVRNVLEYQNDLKLVARSNSTSSFILLYKKHKISLFSSSITQFMQTREYDSILRRLSMSHF